MAVSGQEPGARSRWTGLTALVVAGALVAAGCSSGGSSAGESTTSAATSASVSTVPSTATTAPPAPAGEFPGAEWDRTTPAVAGFDPAKLAAVARTAEVGKSRCLAVVRDGKLVGEWFFGGATATSTQQVFSATKSIASVLVGIAQDDGDLRVGDRASKWIPEWRGTPADAVTIRDLLSMDSGRQWSLALDYTQFIRSSDRTGFAVALDQQHAPGEVWAYNNAAVQTLQKVLEGATGQPVQQFAQERLFDPLGMSHTTMTLDKVDHAQLFAGVISNCADMARLGLLMLNGGRWGNEQLLSSSWVRESTGQSSTTLNVAYGYLWWLNHRGVISGPLVATDLDALKDPKSIVGQLAPGAPADMFWALGLGNQVVQVDPGSRTVVVRLGAGGARPKPPTFGPREASAVVTEALRS